MELLIDLSTGVPSSRYNRIAIIIIYTLCTIHTVGDTNPVQQQPEIAKSNINFFDKINGFFLWEKRLKNSPLRTGERSNYAHSAAVSSECIATFEGISQTIH